MLARAATSRVAKDRRARTAQNPHRTACIQGVLPSTATVHATHRIVSHRIRSSRYVRTHRNLSVTPHACSHSQDGFTSPLRTRTAACAPPGDSGLSGYPRTLRTRVRMRAFWPAQRRLYNRTIHSFHKQVLQLLAQLVSHFANDECACFYAQMVTALRSPVLRNKERRGGAARGGRDPYIKTTIKSRKGVAATTQDRYATARRHTRLDTARHAALGLDTARLHTKHTHDPHKPHTRPHTAR
jgi:hypothetical protein